MSSPLPDAPGPRRSWLTRMLDAPGYFVVIGGVLAVMDLVFIADMFRRPPTALSVALTVIFTALTAALIWYGVHRLRRARAGGGEAGS
ncbi:hypothetical protein JT358_10035 [Micrococcales bacterium 31B]|nr:hypothetical protein [Micrococcales bacterium 31B]